MYLEDGTTVASLAGSASMYVLVLMATLGCRGDLSSIGGGDVLRMAAQFRMPPSGSPWNLVKEQLVPFVAYFRQAHPITMSCIIPSDFMGSVWGRTDSLECGNLEENDKIFDDFYTK
jgi:hypothetical protein